MLNRVFPFIRVKPTNNTPRMPGRALTLPVDPHHERIKTLPKGYCKTCERYLEDHPEIRTDQYFGCFDVQHGDVPPQDRLLQTVEVPPGSGLWVHRYMPGSLLHEEASKHR